MPCGHDAPNSCASRMPVHASTGSGARNRRAPPVGAPYGMPLKTWMPLSTRPRTLPPVVLTIESCTSGTLVPAYRWSPRAPPRWARIIGEWSKIVEMAGYSGKALIDKLGYKPGESVRLLNAPDWFADYVREN